MGRPAFDVWATGDGVRVHPETGQYLEDRPDIHEDYPTGGYRVRNAVWDGAARRVLLHAARNELVSFQLIVESEEPVTGVQAKLDRLIGPGGALIEGEHVALFKAWYVRVEEHSSGYEETSLGPGWYPDALLPSGGDGVVSLDIPDARNGIGPTQRNQSIWVDVYVPRDRTDAPPGEYRGEVVVSSGDGERKIAVELRVWDFSLPDEIHCRGDIWNGSLKRMTPEQELLWYQMAHRHRLHPGVAGYQPDIEGEAENITVDWADYDGRLSRYFDGSAFTDEHGYWGPGYGVPIPHIQLPFNCNKSGRRGGWPAAIGPEWEPDEAYEAAWLAVCRQFREHFDADPTWRKVRKIVFLGGLDESYSDEAYEKMIYYSRLLRKGLGDGWFQYRIDGGYSWRAMDKLHPFVDLWVCHTAGFDAQKMANFRAKGVETWFYGPMVYERRGNSACGSNTFTDLDLLTCRGVGWAAWKVRSGYCEWEFDALYDDEGELKRPTEPFERAWTRAMNCRYGGKEYNGSGLLIYRGELDGSGRPIASIRLKAHRRGFQDYEYFWLLEQAGRREEADALADSIVTAVPFGKANWENTDIWRHDPEAWDAVRVKAGELLHTGSATR